MFQSIFKDERGNALFLILIAVALFAALSYAITQSITGTGSTSEEEETSLDISKLSQYASSVNTALTRMTFSNVDISEIDFTPLNTGTNINDLFADDGTGDDGGINATAGNASIPAAFDGWFINAENQMPGVGVDSLQDVVMFITDIDYATCKEINRQYVGEAPTTSIPDVSASPPNTASSFVGDGSGALDQTTVVDMDDAGGVLNGEITYCVNVDGTADPNGEYVFYYVVKLR